MKELDVAISHKPNSFETYPLHRVCGVIEDKYEANAALEDLLALGIPREDIEISSGDKQDLLNPLISFLQEMGDVENEAYVIYQSAIERGDYVFSVLATSEKERESICDILIANHGFFVNYFGRWTVEAM